MNHILSLFSGLCLTFFVSLSIADSQADRLFYPMDLSILLKSPDSDPVPVWRLLSTKTQTQILAAFKTASEEHEIDLPRAAALAGLRLDPCGANHFSANNQKCMPQLRLIGEDFASEDHSLHLVFELSVPQLQRLAKSLQQLNDRCSALKFNRSLQPHPCTAEKDFRSKLVNLIREYAKDSNLSKVAFQTRIADTPGDTQWMFGAAVKSASKGWSVLKFPWARKGFEIFSFGQGEGSLFPPQRDGIDFMIQEGLEGGLSERRVTTLVKNLEDTRLRTVKNTSCFSCHATQALRSRFSSLTKNNTDYFFISQKERAESSNIGRSDTRHFGYRFGEPKISTRTRIETQEAVKRMNGFFE